MINDKYTIVNGIKTFYIEENSPGEGVLPDILFIHGFLSRGQSFDKLMNGLSGKYHSYAPDLPGCGASEDPKKFKPGFESYGSFLNDFCRELGIKHTVLAGDSMGGAISIMMAVMYPELVEKVILIDSVSYNMKPNVSTKIALIPLLGTFIFRKLFNWNMFKSLFMKDIYVENSKIDQAELYENYKLFDNPSRREFTYRIMRSVTYSAEVEAVITKVKQPVLVIWGESDRMLPLDNAKRLSKDIKKAKLVIIPGAGHASFDENPEMALEAILEFLQK